MKKIIFVFFVTSSVVNGILSSEKIICDGYRIWQRPLINSFVTGLKKGGKHALLFSSPVVLLGLVNDDIPGVEALGLPCVMGFFGSMCGAAIGTTSALLPIKKEDCSKMVLRQKFINRAGMLAAHSGTFLGTAAFMSYLCNCYVPKQTDVYYIPTRARD